MNIEADKVRRAGPPAHEQVYRQLREMVLCGELEPGQPVTIQGLVEATGAGMTPVREALRRLTAEGALAALGNRRIVVPVLDERLVDELTAARVALEPLLAARAVPQVDEAALLRLSETDTRLDRAIARGDIALYLRENHVFHAELHALAQAPILGALVDSLWLRFGPSLRVVCGQVGTRNLPDRHKDLLTALAMRDADAAAEAVRLDVLQGMDMIRAAL